MRSSEAESQGVILDQPLEGREPPRRRSVEDSVPRGLKIAAAFSWRLLVVAAAGLLAGYAMTQLLVVVIPFVVALLLTSLLHSPSLALQRRGVPRTLAAAIVVGAGLLVLAGLLGLVIPPFVDQVNDLASRVEEGARKLASSIAGGPFGLTEQEIDEAVDRAIDGLDGNAGSVASGVLSGALIAAEVGAAMLLTLFLTFFMVRDGDRLWRWIVGLAAPESRRTVVGAGEHAWTALSGYVRGVAIVATADAVFIGIALVIVGVPLAFPLIVLTFMAAFFPIVGAFTAGGAAVLVALVANGLTEALIILGAIIVVQQIEGNVLYPIIVGSRLRLHPVAMLLVLGIGGVLAGIAGAFLAVPIAAVVSAVLEYMRSAERQVVYDSG